MVWFMIISIFLFFIEYAEEQIFTTVVFINVGIYLAVSIYKVFGGRV